jgi:hypothetical protein
MISSHDAGFSRDHRQSIPKVLGRVRKLLQAHLAHTLQSKGQPGSGNDQATDRAPLKLATPFALRAARLVYPSGLFIERNGFIWYYFSV